MDTRRNPIFNDLQVELGNIQVRCDGAGTACYVVEAAANLLPNLLRYQIVNAIENPMRKRIQERLNHVNMGKVIIDSVQDFENNSFNTLYHLRDVFF